MTANRYGPKRFIAGAVCPRCAQVDKIVLYRVSDTGQTRECVRCGFHETISDEPPAEEPKTRVNQPRPGEKPLPHEDKIDVVKIVDPGTRGKL